MSKTSWQANGVHTQWHDLSGIKGWKKSIHKLAGGINDFKPAWPKVAKILAESVEKEFSSNGRHQGFPWKKPAAEYQDYKRKVGMHSEIGKFYGEIYDHYTDPRRALQGVGSMSMSFGGGSAQGLDHARSMNFGMKGEGFRAKSHTRRKQVDKIQWAGQGAKNKRPQRALRFLGWTKENYWLTYSVIAQHAQSIVKRSGLKLTGGKK